jgi:phosphoadenosine phosphosulfate reductase
MPPVRLGKLVLRWCSSCNVPILSSKICPRCDSKTKPVKLTPPGDIRPAFDFDIELLTRIIDEQFGPGCGAKFLPENELILLNRAPDIDRLDEVIFDGSVQGALKFDLYSQGFKFLPRLSGARRFLDTMSKGYVKVDPGAVRPILTGSSVLAPGVTHASLGIDTGDEVLIFDDSGYLIGLGIAVMTSEQMLKQSRGLAVKVRWHEAEDTYKQSKKDFKLDKIENNSSTPNNNLKLKPNEILESSEKTKPPIYKNPTWKLAIETNKTLIEELVVDAQKFIRSTIEQQKLPVAVSFSGGKDSLATLLLVLDTGLKPILLFIDTGLEFPETVKHVHEVAEKFDLDLSIERPNNSFWDNLEYFGPPGKDYRWCCKTCKLGPVTGLIKEQFPDGVLSFIGQRRYESEQRSKKGKVWHNPWVPGQIGASPIQNWSALHVWIYLFMKGVDFNPLYEHGLERIGCWLCPASDMADLDIVSEKHPDIERWNEALNNYANSNSFSKDWITYGLWRWKRMPRGIEQLIDDRGISLRSTNQKSNLILQQETDVNFDASKSDSRGFELKLADGFIDCKYGLSLEGVFTKKLDMARVVNLMNIIGEPEYNKKAGYCTINDRIDIYPEGVMVVKGSSPKEIKKYVNKMHAIVRRAMECIGCGVCIGRCKENALYINDTEKPNRIMLEEDRCQQCGKCLGPCPVVNFNAAFEFEM